MRTLIALAFMAVALAEDKPKEPATRQELTPTEALDFSVMHGMLGVARTEESEKRRVAEIAKLEHDAAKAKLQSMEQLYAATLAKKAAERNAVGCQLTYELKWACPDPKQQAAAKPEGKK